MAHPLYAAIPLAIVLGAALLPRNSSAITRDDIVLEGELRFLETLPEPSPYRFESTAILNADSIKTGIVQLSSCHYGLDPIRRVVVAFNPKRLISMQVLSHRGIESVEIDGATVDMRGVSKGADICIGVTSKSLDTVAEGQYMLHAGPLQRQFLDGFFPMAAKLNVNWPAESLKFQGFSHPVQPGVALSQGEGEAELKVQFAGRFKGSFLFEAVTLETGSTSR